MTTNKELQERRAKNVPRGVATAFPIFVDHVKNAELWDVEGKRYIDFAGGIAVQNTGHCHPKVVEAIKRQVDRCIHSAFQVVAYEPYIELTEKLNSLVPVNGPTAKSILFSSGAEAVENAVKIAKVATKRSGVIAFLGGFHGRTNLSMALTGKVIPYKKGMGPFPSGIYHAAYPMPYHGVTSEDSLKGIEKIFKASIDPSEVAAIIIEPVQGEGGFYIAPFDFLKKLREICDKNGILLIADEVQTGFARTGKLFAMEHSAVKADIFTIAKSIAGGVPLSAVVGRADVMDAAEPGNLGGTYAGNPLGCAAALAVLEVIESEKICEKSMKLGELLTSELRKLAAKFQSIGEIRALGGMVAFELVKNQQTHEPDADAANKLKSKAMEQGLLLLTCGVYSNTIRILVPLTASDEIVREGIKIIEKCLG